MVSEKILIRNKTGLHMRPASELSALCGKFKCNIALVHGEKRVNPKSILMMMGAGLKAGTEIVVECEGENEAEALEAILAAIKGGFGEELVC